MQLVNAISNVMEDTDIVKLVNNDFIVNGLMIEGNIVNKTY